MKFLKKGNIQGNSLYIYRVRTDIGQGLRDYNWIIKSNAMGALTQKCSTTTPPVCTATFTGKNNITAVDRVTGIATSLGGNYEFQVDVTDKGEPGSDGSTPSDSYATRIWKDTGTYYVLGAYGTNNTGTTNTGQVPIQGGNIRVRP